MQGGGGECSGKGGVGTAKGRGVEGGGGSDTRESIDEEYRGISLMRNTPLPGPCSRTIPRVPWWPQGGGLFVMSEVPLYGRKSLGTIVDV